MEQNLHHFISKSSWDWRPVRRLLAKRIERMVAPKAWVVDEMVIPKRGPHTVGVDRTFVPQLGRITNNQRAFGVWLVTEQESFPVNWRLLLPPKWAACPSRRRQADIPEALAAESPDVCALNAALEMVDGWNLDRRPLIMDARDGDVPRLVTELAARDVPFLIRIGGSVQVATASSSGLSLQPARRIADLMVKLRQPVEWHDVGDSSWHRSLAVATPVTLVVAAATDRAPRRRTVDLTLLAEWHGRGQAPASLWLTNLGVPAASLVRLSKLPRQVAKDFAEVCTGVGIQDFEGRSFTGWHRHVTLASVAHAVQMTARALRTLIPRARTHEEHLLAGSGARSRS